MANYIFVTGGVISGLGKGVTSASIGAILQMMGETKVMIKKLDPYLNIDPGTMNPMEHGEVFITRDGNETDLDLGYYERFLGIDMNHYNSTSSGKLYQKLLNKEREGGYLGKTVQMIPHFTDIIKEYICYKSEEYDYIICEIGGSSGDIEAMAFYEAIRQLKYDLGDDRVMFIHLTYLIYYSITKELKTKPTQNAIRELQQKGIFPEILICRSENEISEDVKNKLSMYTNLSKNHIINAQDVNSIYEVPLRFIEEGVNEILSEKFCIGSEINVSKWDGLNKRIVSLKDSITIGILGKYVKLNDAYKSLLEAIYHSGIRNNYLVNIEWLDARSENISQNQLDNIQGVIIPGGFGETGIENMIQKIYEIRLRGIPTLGICLGMQLMVIEYLRNVCGCEGVGSSEFNNNGRNAIIRMNNENIIGGTMRLGDYEIELKEDSLIYSIYSMDRIMERHRHRYMVDEEYVSELEKYKMNISGLSSDKIIEVIELDKGVHNWYIGCQYHPEFNSSPFEPHPLFLSYINECLKKKVQ